MAATFGSDLLGDSLGGTPGDDTLYGGANGGTGGGADTLNGAGGADTLFGGADNDVLTGGAGIDLLFGGTGSDRLHVDADDTTILGGDGIDTATYTAGADVVVGARDIQVERVALGAGADVFDVSSSNGSDVRQLSQLDGTNGSRLDGAAAGAMSAWSTGVAGDVNDDGYDDLIVGGAASGSPGFGYVVFGSAAGLPATFALSSLNGATGFRLDGAAANDQAGWSVAAAGDVNGDGVDDLIVGAPQADPHGSNSGSSYVVYGHSAAWAATLELSSLDGTSGFRIDGASASELSGRSVSSAGDVNDDGYDDLIVGAPQGSAGAAYVVFGGPSGGAATVSLSSLDGTNGFRLDGAAFNDFAGAAVAGAGDANGDGVDDLVVGASGADPNGSASGSAYVVFGHASPWTATLALSSLDGTTGYRLDGQGSSANAGQAVSSAGDVNDDGYDDVIVGALNTAGGGAAYVVFGRAGGWSPTANLTALDGATGFRIDGLASGSLVGAAVSAAGDVNGDGVDDLIVGAFGASPNGTNSGSAFVIYGRASGWSSTLSLSTLDAASGFRLDGAAAHEYTGWSVGGGGDFDGDGLDDVIVGAPLVDSNGSDSGSSYVVYGQAAPGAAETPYTVYGEGGADTIVGKGGADLLDGGTENDSLAGGGDTDTLRGVSGDDVLAGDAGGDWLYGGDQADALYGGADADKLWGGVGIDVLYGGGGNDSLRGDAGADVMAGGAGVDYYWVDDAGDVLDETAAGSDGSDTVWVGVSDYDVAESVERINVELATGATIDALGPTDNLIHGADGADTFFAGAGADGMWGGLGTDVLRGQAGADTAYGGGGVDRLYGGDEADRLYGDADADTVWGEAGADLAYGGSGNDTVDGADGDDRLYGDADADRLYGESGADQAYGGAGNDIVDGGDGADRLYGGAGVDTLFGEEGDDRLDPGVDLSGVALGGDGVDKLVLDFTGVVSAVSITGSDAAGNVVAGGVTVMFTSIEQRDIVGGSGADRLNGGAGVDRLEGAGGDDTLSGMDGVDALLGGSGNDRLNGGAGVDALDGGDGADTLQGAAGSDAMTGGAGADLFRIASGDGVDTIADFVHGQDQVDLVGSLAVSGGLGTDTVLLTGGGSIFASNGYHWQAADFV